MQILEFTNSSILLQTQHRRTVTILLLNGTKVNVICNPTTTVAKQVFEAILKLEKLSENFFLGLCALIGGDFVFLPHDLKVYKVRFRTSLTRTQT